MVKETTQQQEWPGSS